MTCADCASAPASQKLSIDQPGVHTSLHVILAGLLDAAAGKVPPFQAMAPPHVHLMAARPRAGSWAGASCLPMACLPPTVGAACPKHLASAYWRRGALPSGRPAANKPRAPSNGCRSPRPLICDVVWRQWPWCRRCKSLAAGCSARATAVRSSCLRPSRRTPSQRAGKVCPVCGRPDWGSTPPVRGRGCRCGERLGRILTAAQPCTSSSCRAVACASASSCCQVQGCCTWQLRSCAPFLLSCLPLSPPPLIPSPAGWVEVSLHLVTIMFGAGVLVSRHCPHAAQQLCWSSVVGPLAVAQPGGSP